MRYIYLLGALILCYTACVKTTGPDKSARSYTFFNLPTTLDSFTIPENNILTKERIALGRQLFYDPILSVDSSISCASCHKPELFFADNKATTPGVFGRAGTRNVPSLINTAFSPYFTREGGVPTLEMQVSVPVQEHNEFAFNMVKVAERIARVHWYDSMSQLAYDRAPDPFVVTRALAAFERTLIAFTTPFDQWFFYGDKGAMSSLQIEGYKLFMSNKTKCSNCHSPPHFTNYAFANNGLTSIYPDKGRMSITGDTADYALYKIASLRNVAATAPYMLDGRIATLEGVINHYNSGGATHSQKASFIQPLFLSDREKASLLAFLNALTDQDTGQEKWGNPFFRK
jgi:cytochrome c peroxidase